MGDCIFMASPFKFLIETRDELVKVNWPSRAEVIRLTIVVITVSVIVGLYIGGLDFVLTKLLELVVK
jgi:preprotein translocase subunit SecE